MGLVDGLGDAGEQLLGHQDVRIGLLDDLHQLVHRAAQGEHVEGHHAQTRLGRRRGLQGVGHVRRAGDEQLPVEGQEHGPGEGGGQEGPGAPGDQQGQQPQGQGQEEPGREFVEQGDEVVELPPQAVRERLGHRVGDRAPEQQVGQEGQPVGQRQEADQAKHVCPSPETKLQAARPAAGCRRLTVSRAGRRAPTELSCAKGARRIAARLHPAPAGARAAQPSSQRALASNSSSTIERMSSRGWSSPPPAGRARRPGGSPPGRGAGSP